MMECKSPRASGTCSIFFGVLLEVTIDLLGRIISLLFLLYRSDDTDTIRYATGKSFCFVLAIAFSFQGGSYHITEAMVRG